MSAAAPPATPTPAEALSAAFRTAKSRGRAAFVPFVTAGYPAVDQTVPILLAMQRAGADVVELGVPYSDPMADGAVVESANIVALANGMTFAKTLQLVRDARAAGLTVPVVLMGYVNPLLAFGEEAAVREARAAGANGFIVVDLPPEEAGAFLGHCGAEGMGFVPLVAPTSTDARMRELAKTGSGFVYCVSVAGVTGAREHLPPHLAEFLARVRAAFPALPLAVGFGLSTRAHVAAVGEIAEGAVMGSAIIAAIDRGGAAEVEAFIGGLLG